MGVLPPWRLPRPGMFSMSGTVVWTIEQGLPVLRSLVPITSLLRLLRFFALNPLVRYRTRLLGRAWTGRSAEEIEEALRQAESSAIIREKR